MKRASVIALFGLLLSFVSHASNTTCVYPAQSAYLQQIAQYANDHGWQVHCSAKAIGAYYAKNGLNLADLNALAALSNQVLAEGQAPITGKTYGEGAVMLYLIFQGGMTEQIAQTMALQIVNGFFGSSNQFNSFNVIAPPDWYTDPSCYNQSGTIANVLRNNTLAGMNIGMSAFISAAIADFPQHCSGYSTDYKQAIKALSDFFQGQYAYCQQMMSNTY